MYSDSRDQYITNAVHDIEMKVKQKDEYLREELEAAAYLIRASEYQAGALYRYTNI
jgi:hypothetical protein